MMPPSRRPRSSVWRVGAIPMSRVLQTRYDTSMRSPRSPTRIGVGQEYDTFTQTCQRDCNSVRCPSSGGRSAIARDVEFRLLLASKLSGSAQLPMRDLALDPTITRIRRVTLYGSLCYKRVPSCRAEAKRRAPKRPGPSRHVEQSHTHQISITTRSRAGWHCRASPSPSLPANFVPLPHCCPATAIFPVRRFHRATVRSSDIDVSPRML